MKKAIIEFIHVSQSLTIHNSKESPAPGKCNRNLVHMLKCAHDMLTLCKLRGSQLQLFHCLRTINRERDMCRTMGLAAGVTPQFQLLYHQILSRTVTVMTNLETRL